MNISERADKLHRESLVVDTHVDTLLACVYGRRSLTECSEEGHVDLPRLRDGGVNVQLFAHYIEPAYKPDRGLLRFMQMADVFFSEVEKADDAEVAYSGEDIERINGESKIACVLSIEGGEAIQGDLGVLRVLHRLGVRCLGLTWNQRNQLADGVGESRTGGGLTRIGVKAIEEMNRLGIVVDVSHVSKPGFWDVVEVSEQPFIASHSNARAVCDHPRNLTDEQICALAESGGVMGMNFAPYFVDEEVRREAQRIRSQGLGREDMTKKASIDSLLDHIDHIVDLVGIEHVGVGSDFDGIGDTPEGLEDVTCMPRLTEGLIQRGYEDDKIRAILGGNFMRVFKQVWGS